MKKKRNLLEPYRVCATAVASLTLLAACGSGGGSAQPSPGPVPGCDPSVEHCGTIPQSANACSDTQFWPLSTDSGIRPITVHYSRLADEQKAMEMIGILEQAWTVQVDDLGFSAPLDDQGLCGADGRYDVFIWRGVDGAFVDAIDENLATPHDDYFTYMAMDISGQNGTTLLDTTLAHEFNHAVQASDDWWESALIFEMSATFVEALVYPAQDDYFFTLEDFQARPEWSLFYDDNYATWYMYGAAMYLHFLRERYFPSDAAFIARVWRGMRSDAGVGRPDYLDALRDVLLSDRGVTLDETVVEFMQWRWFVAQFDDGNHFQSGDAWPYPVAFIEVDVGMLPMDVDLSAMMYGANYLRIVNSGAADVDVSVDLQENDPEVTWSLTTVDGGTIGGNFTVPAQTDIVLVPTVLPAVAVSAGTLSFDPRNATLSLDVM